MKTIFKIALTFSFISTLFLSFIVYKQHKEIEEIKNQTLEIEKKIDVNSFNKGFNDSFNQDIGSKVLELESEMENLKSN